jgi:hypothetical protein
MKGAGRGNADVLKIWISVDQKMKKLGPGQIISAGGIKIDALMK